MDKKEDYDFELVKPVPSTAIKKKVIMVDKTRFGNATLVNKQDIDKVRENFSANLLHSLENMGVQFTPGTREKHTLETKSQRDRKKRIQSNRTGGLIQIVKE